VHALCPHSRNLTDRQLDAIRDTGGLAGINFGVLFLRDDGVRDPNTSLDLLVRHVAYIAERIGIDHVALGSDFDGTTIPTEMKDAAGLPRLAEALRRNGFNDAEMKKIAYENWVSVLERSWAA
jgi:membrane dipeptidase